MTRYLIDRGDFFIVQNVNTNIDYKPSEPHVVLDDSVPKEDEPFLYIENINGELFPRLDSEKKEAFQSNDDLQKLKLESKTQYLEDVENEMGKFFSTKNIDTAVSLCLTWMLMDSYPQFYVNRGVKDSDGKVLDTTQSVKAFAKQKIKSTIDYSIFLLKRRNQYTDESNS